MLKLEIRYTADLVVHMLPDWGLSNAAGAWKKPPAPVPVAETSLLTALGADLNPSTELNTKIELQVRALRPCTQYSHCLPQSPYIRGFHAASQAWHSKICDLIMLAWFRLGRQ